MPLPGEETAKLGFRYEDLWTAGCMLDVLSESVEGIHLVPHGQEGEGIEFILYRGGQREFHQVKRQQSSTGHWNVSSLSNVLKTFQQKLAEPNTICYFVSMQEAYPLRELSENARFASSAEQLSQNYLSQGNRAAGFDNLRKALGASGEQAYEFLRRTHFKTIDKDEARRLVDLQIERQIEGSPDVIRPMLIEYASINLHRKLTAVDIWEFLEKNGFSRTNWAKDNTILSLQVQQNERFLNSLRPEIILGTIISRPEVLDIEKTLHEDGGKRIQLLTGKAGVGKSTVLLEVVLDLLKRRIPVLAFRVDRLNAVPTPRDVGAQLGFKASPAMALARIAQDEGSVLVIDQLDAVSMISGRNPEFLDCIDEIIRETQDLKKMRVLISCRKFDLDNDGRLRKLTSDQETSLVDVKPLSPETVKEVLKKLGISDSKLTPSQVDLLSIPLHLRLLADSLKAGGSEEVLNFRTVKDLYDNFWKYKRSYIETIRLKKTIAWTEIIGRLSQWMSENQTLAAANHLVDTWSSDADVLVSEHVLVADAGKLSFFHEGFFDYSFARTFLSQGGRLGDLLNDNEQALFRRSQVRQILLHEREADFGAYLTDLDYALNDSKIRMHLKQLVLNMLKEVRDPSSEELNVVLKSIDNSGCERAAASLFMKNMQWFELLDEEGYLRNWLEGDGTNVNRALWILMSIQAQCADRVADLLRPFLGASEEWNLRLKNVISRGDWNVSRKYFELCKGMVEAGEFEPKDEGLRSIVISHAVSTLPKANPEWAVELLVAWLDRLTNVDVEDLVVSEYRGSILDRSLDEEFLHETAKGTPVRFVEEVLPLIVCMIEKTAVPAGSRPRRDRIWPYRFDQHRLGGDAAVLSAAALALSEVAQNFPDKFESIFTRYSNTEYDTLQYLLTRALAANPVRFADLAMRYLCGSDHRLECGYVGTHREYYLVATELVRKASPHCKGEELEAFLNKILGYYPDYERSKKGLSSRGYAQMLFLEAVDQIRITHGAQKRLYELKRKFPEEKIEIPRTSGFGSVPSPVPEQATGKMTDEQWRSAIAKYSTDDLGHGDDGGLVGGAGQLAHSFGEAAKKEPSRFAILAANLPVSINATYFASVLSALAEARTDPESLFKVIRRCHVLPNKQCGRSICWALQKYRQERIPDDILAILQWYALNDPDPDRELWGTPASGGAPYYGGSIHDAGINSVRGAAAEALGGIIFSHKEILPKVSETISRLVNDPLIAVRSCVATTLLGVLNHDRDVAIKLFMELINTDDLLLRTRPVEDFLYYALYTHYEALLPVIDRMLKSSTPQVSEVAARRVCLLAVDVKASQDLAKQCLEGNEEMRKGAAKIFATNISVKRFREFCEAALIKLFNDPCEGVRSEASSCFRHLEGDELQYYRALVESFLSSRSFAENYDDLIRAVDKTTALIPDVTCTVCRAFVDLVGQDAANAAKKSAATGYEVTKLAVRAYAQAQEKELKSRCLDLIDRLMELGVYGVEEELSTFER